MTSGNLDNLVQANQLKVEPADQAEFDGLVGSARKRIADAGLVEVSEEGRFLSAYGAAYSLALAALRWHGFRPQNRYIAFQCLQHTVGLPREKWRVLDTCHKQRNLAEYEGHLELPGRLFEDLLAISKDLLVLVEELGPVKEKPDRNDQKG
jgi:hypothetical protein